MSTVNENSNKDVSEKMIGKYSEKIKELENNLQNIQFELVKSRQKLGDAINAAMEYGGPEFVDRLTTAIQNSKF